MTLPNVYILSVTFAFFLCFWFHNGKANNNNKKKRLNEMKTFSEQAIFIERKLRKRIKFGAKIFVNGSKVHKTPLHSKFHIAYFNNCCNYELKIEHAWIA